MGAQQEMKGQTNICDELKICECVCVWRAEGVEGAALPACVCFYTDLLVNRPAGRLFKLYPYSHSLST